jgi:threonine dehydratase
MYNFFYGTSHPQGETLADGLSGEIESDSITLGLCRAYCDSIVLVEETSIREAIVWALRHHNWVLEGAGAVGIAAFLTGQIRPDERLTLLVLSGGNIDYEVLRGLL